MYNDKKLIELKNLVEAAEISLQQARQILVEVVGSQEEKMMAEQAKKSGTMTANEEGQVIEGVFDGQNMVGPDEKKYSVPANYASKSKLVEGDSLKLTITLDGSFVYKQIKLLDRDRLVGELLVDGKTDEYRVLANNKSYKVLTASVTYYKGEPGEKATILVPKGRESTWAAVENIFKPGEEIEQPDEALTAVEDVDKEKSETKPEEFLEQEPAKDKGLDLDNNDLKNKPLATEAEESQPKNVLAAMKEVKTDDVKEIKEPEIEIKDESMAEKPLVDNLNQAKDNQGLEEI